MRKMRGARALAMALAVAMMVCGIAGSTLAWLVAKTDVVTNTFTYGDINITLEETPTDDGDNNPNTNGYKMVPGRVITKDPAITVEAGSENCWLFAKLVESEGFDNFMTYEIAEGWTELEDGVYYRTATGDFAANGVTFNVLKNDQVVVKGSVTKEMLNDLNGVYPTLTLAAYAVQMENIDTVELAWKVAMDPFLDLSTVQTTTPDPAAPAA